MTIQVYYSDLKTLRSAHISLDNILFERSFECLE